MTTREATDLEVALAQLRALMLLRYGGTIIAAKSEEEKREAFTSLIATGIEVIAGAVCSRKPHDDAMQITIENFPQMLTDAVTDHLQLRSMFEAAIQRDGATVQ